MQLHRTKSRPDWTDVPIHQRNRWQRLAARTQGVITPGNAITTLGLILVAIGLVYIAQHHYWLGFVVVALGRFCDVLDGWAAHRTGTKSPLGESLDVGFDKLTVLGMLFTLFVVHIAPAWLLVVMLLPHLISSAITVLAYLSNRHIHPSRTGKYAMAGLWIVLGCFIAAKALGWAHGGVLTTLEIAAVLVAGAGYYNAYEYAFKSN